MPHKVLPFALASALGIFQSYSCSAAPFRLPEGRAGCPRPFLDRSVNRSFNTANKANPWNAAPDKTAGRRLDKIGIDAKSGTFAKRKELIKIVGGSAIAIAFGVGVLGMYNRNDSLLANAAYHVGRILYAVSLSTTRLVGLVADAFLTVVFVVVFGFLVGGIFIIPVIFLGAIVGGIFSIPKIVGLSPGDSSEMGDNPSPAPAPAPVAPVSMSVEEKAEKAKRLSASSTLSRVRAVVEGGAYPVRIFNEDIRRPKWNEEMQRRREKINADTMRLLRNSVFLVILDVLTDVDVLHLWAFRFPFQASVILLAFQIWEQSLIEKHPEQFYFRDGELYSCTAPVKEEEGPMPGGKRNDFDFLDKMAT